MTTSYPSTDRRTRSRWLRRTAVAAVVLVPLAFAGLFVGALPHGDRALDSIPAAIVNQDQLIYQTAADGTKTPVFAGRQLVTELTGKGAGFDWTLSNAADAKRALAAGRVQAVLTVPKNFSSSILSLSSASPQHADLSIRTDDAHSYLTGVVAQAVGSGMVNTFGKTITERYISGITTGISELGSSLGTAATGAGSLTGAANGLSGGLAALSDGAAATRGGAAALSSGVTKYTSGVDGLSGGLARLNAGAAGLSGVRDGVASYTGSVTQLATALGAANAALKADPGNPQALGTIDALSGRLSTAAAGGTQLSRHTADAIGGIQGAIAQSAAGAAKLSTGSAGLRSGANSLVGGLDRLASGVAGASSGASQLAGGATDLASGLKAGADRVPATDPDSAAASADVAADPVRLTVTRDHEVRGIGQVITIFFVPLGLWVGALAVFLVLRPVTRRALDSTASTGRIVFGTLLRAGAVTIAQALLLTGLMHGIVNVPWSELGATLGFSVLMALAFTAFHYLLTVGFGRAGLVVSLFALAVQLTSTGGLYPIEVLSAPFQRISPWLPLTYGVSGMQDIIAGGSAGSAVAATAALLAFGVLSVLASLVVLRATRRAHALRQLRALPVASAGYV